MSDNPRKNGMATMDESVFRPEDICWGCRCGWLCCDCRIGCAACKERLRYCYCKHNIFPNMCCENCVLYWPMCECDDSQRCKWCRVSLTLCQRGGCIRLLPDRWSPAAEPLVRFFNEDEEEPEDGPVEGSSSNNADAPEDTEGSKEPLQVCLELRPDPASEHEEKCKAEPVSDSDDSGVASVPESPSTSDA